MNNFLHEVSIAAMTSTQEIKRDFAINVLELVDECTFELCNLFPQKRISKITGMTILGEKELPLNI